MGSPASSPIHLRASGVSNFICSFSFCPLFPMGCCFCSVFFLFKCILISLQAEAKCLTSPEALVFWVESCSLQSGNLGIATAVSGNGLAQGVYKPSTILQEVCLQ